MKRLESSESNSFLLRIVAINWTIPGAIAPSQYILSRLTQPLTLCLRPCAGKMLMEFSRSATVRPWRHPMWRAASAFSIIIPPPSKPAAANCACAKFFAKRACGCRGFVRLRLRQRRSRALLGIIYPCVAKPLSLSASQGVVRANSREEFIAAATRIRRLLESPEIRATREPNLDQILVEGYIPGREVAVEGLLTDGKLRVLAIFDKPDPLEGPYFEETIYITPSRFTESQQREIERCAVDAVRALGLSQGPVHAEFRINEDGVWPLEVAPRPIGGLCARALRFAPDVASQTIGLEELLLRHALGLPGSDWPRENSASGVMMIPVPKSGVLEKIEGEDAARGIGGITGLEITARLHDYIAAWPEGSSYLGFLFATGNGAEEVEEALRAAHAKLRFELRPRLPVEHPGTGRLPAVVD